jgi:predicted amidohydrolase
MDEFITTCVQQQIRVFESHGEFRNDIQRFMRLAKIKESHLVIFPELCGLLLAPPLVPGLKRTLLRVAERQVKRKPSLIDRMVGRIANSATDALGGIGGHIMEAFAGRIDTLRDAYLTIFSETAREYEMYILAGSIYLPDARDGQMHNTAHLFGPTGEVIGQQSKITLDFADTLFCKPATTGLEVFDTDFGKLGILIGQDVLFPESGRILGALGAAFVAHLVAAPGQGAFTKLRNALAARLQENVMLGAQSCLVGKNIVTSPKNEKNDYIGKSAILAPAEMTTRYSGVLGEVGSMVTDGVISAVWDTKRLYELRSTIDVPTHEPFRNEVLRRQIQAIYGIIAETPAAPAPTAAYAPIPEPEAATPEAALTAEPREGEPEAELAASGSAALEADTGQPAAALEAESVVEMAGSGSSELPPLPLVYVAEPVVAPAAPADETPAAPPESPVIEPAASAEPDAVESSAEAVEEIVPLQLRVPESFDDGEPARTETHRDDADRWPALEDLAVPADPEMRLLLSPTDETGREESPPPSDQTSTEQTAGPETDEPPPPTETGANQEDEPQPPPKKRRPFWRR